MITKTGKALIDQDKLVAGVSAAESLAGLGLIDNALNRGQLTGRETLFHGTDPRSAESIRASGLRPVTEETAKRTQALKYDPERYAKSLGKSYMTRNWLEALGYTQDGMFGIPNPSGVVKLNVPTWKMKQVMNPEVDMPFNKWREVLYKETDRLGVKRPSEFQLRRVYDSLRKSVVVEGGVSNQYVKGSNFYKGNSLNEIRQFIKAKPGKFALGASKSVLGIAAGAHGLYNLYRRTEGNLPA